ncbi:MAG: HD family hydrolase [Thermoanaerobaculia bacterium]
MQEIVDFVLEIEKLKGVTRKVRPLGLDRYENSAEHSWQLALFATALVGYAAEPVDLDRVVAMLLVHDVGEIDAGDVMAFAGGDTAARSAEELAAVSRIFGILSGTQGDRFVALWREFEAGETAESRFAQAVDRAMPVLLNLHNRGQSWRENGISHERVVRRIEGQIRAGCPALWEYLESRLDEARALGHFGA